nr:DUF262 domain-containing protein [Vibrio crassostreae]
MYFKKTDESLSNLLDNNRSGELILSPSFQRNYVWDQTRASRLIESVLMSIPLPAVYFYQCDYNDEKVYREVIDGKQRLSTLLYFMTGESLWEDVDEFRLKSKFKCLNGKSFRELDKSLILKLKQTKIRVIEMADSIDEETRLSTFERINTGSVSLNHQEIRNCISRGAFNNFLKSYAKEPLCDKLFGDAGEGNKRMEREEALLEILTFFESSRSRNLNKKYLDRFMIQNKDADEKELKRFRVNLNETLRKVVMIFGEKPFTNVKGNRIDGRSLQAVCKWVYDNRNVVLSDATADNIRTRFFECKSEPNFGGILKKNEKLELIFKYLDKTLSSVEDKDPNRLFSRDMAFTMYTGSEDKKCGICNNKIMSFSDAEVDHITPWSLGGRTNLENAQLTHMLCNRKKGASHG